MLCMILSRFKTTEFHSALSNQQLINYSDVFSVSSIIAQSSGTDVTPLMTIMWRQITIFTNVFTRRQWMVDALQLAARCIVLRPSDSQRVKRSIVTESSEDVRKRRMRWVVSERSCCETVDPWPVHVRLFPLLPHPLSTLLTTNWRLHWLSLIDTVIIASALVDCCMQSVCGYAPDRTFSIPPPHQPHVLPLHPYTRITCYDICHRITVMSKYT